MTDEERQVFADLADAYRILREAYYHDMARGEPAANELQTRVKAVLARAGNSGQPGDRHG